MTNEEKCNYTLEEQIFDCYFMLGVPAKNPYEMSEDELLEAEEYLAKFFEWKPHPECSQWVPYLRTTGECVCDVRCIER